MIDGGGIDQVTDGRLHLICIFICKLDGRFPVTPDLLSKNLASGRKRATK